MEVVEGVLVFVRDLVTPETADERATIDNANEILGSARSFCKGITNIGRLTDMAQACRRASRLIFDQAMKLDEELTEVGRKCSDLGGRRP